MAENNLPSDPEAFQSMVISFLENRGDLVASIIDCVRYAAFDVLAFRRKIEKSVSKYDLKFLVMMFLVNKKKISKTCHLKLQILTRKLDIKRRANGNSQVLTLFRIAQTFPEEVALILEAHPNISGLISLEQIRSHSGYSEFPVLGIQPLLACLLPKTHTESLNILNVFLLANMLLSETAYMKSEVWGNKSNLEKAIEIKTKQRNSFDSRVFNEDLRKNWCTRLNIMVDNEYSSVWKEAATKSKAKLVSVYGISF